MSQIEAVIQDLRHLPEPKIAQVAAYVHDLRHTTSRERRQALQETAGCMTPAEADAFDRVIEEGCERIDHD